MNGLTKVILVRSFYTVSNGNISCPLETSEERDLFRTIKRQKFLFITLKILPLVYLGSNSYSSFALFIIDSTEPININTVS